MSSNNPENSVGRFGITTDPEVRRAGLIGLGGMVLALAAGVSGYSYEHLLKGDQVTPLIRDLNFDLNLAQALRYGGAIAAIAAYQWICSWRPRNGPSAIEIEH